MFGTTPILFIMWSDEMERRAAEMRLGNSRRKAARIPSEPLYTPSTAGAPAAIERHYTVQEICEMWQLSGATVIRLFREEPGVVKIGPANLRGGRRPKFTLRIPESVLQRVHRRLSMPPNPAR